MGEYKTPGVYIKEKNAFGNSVVEAATAIPAFIGYTEKALNGNDDLTNIPWKISSMTEFIQYFGGAPALDLSMDIAKYHVGLTKDDLDKLTDDNKKKGLLKPVNSLFQLNIDNTGKSETLTFKPEEGETVEYPIGISVLAQGESKFTLYYNMLLFFANGGGTCYVVSVGHYDAALNKEAIIDAIATLKKENEVTMLVIPEAVKLPDSTQLRDVQTSMLQHCGDVMKNCFALLDIYPKENENTRIDDQIRVFHDGIGSSFLSYGAAYFPWLNTSVLSDRDIDGEKVDWNAENIIKNVDLLSVKDAVMSQILYDAFGIVKLIEENNKSFILNGVNLLYQNITVDILKVGVFKTLDIIGEDDINNKIKKFSFVKNKILLFSLSIGEDNKVNFLDNNGNPISLDSNGEKISGGASSYYHKANKTLILYHSIIDKADKLSLHLALYNGSFVYKEVIKGILAKLNLLPPSAAMAGIYTMVDNNRGVWKAPANVTLNYVNSPAEDIDDEHQADLNAPMNGKAINVIRAFRGEGVKVWGARTLDGNSLDWRYINVRRTLLFLEESVKNAARAYVFEPNDAGTWMNMKCMIENFLRSVWKRGGLAGASPEDAFEVHVGLGDTMTGEDILEGIMRITVLVAVTHPAEFIEITFQQQMQKS
nr:phage tail sheath subtilisin-like domain-containing protein [Parabacteroides goldsteinii]